MKTVFVLTPSGSRAEMNEVRELLEGRQVVMGAAWGHVPGQRLDGDVIVVGGGARGVEQDARGEVQRHADMAALRRSLRRDASAKVEEPPSAPEPEPAPEPAPPPDPAEGMNRSEMIRAAAEKWPGEKQWALLTNDELRAEIRGRSSD